MRLIIFIFFTCKALLAEEYTIQLMSYKLESSLTPYFMNIVKKTGLESRIFSEDGLQKITIGSFSTKSEAIRERKRLKCLPDDVFIRRYPKKDIKPVVENEKISVSKVQELACPKCPLSEPCKSLKTKNSRRSCEIRESLDYLRNSGYYRFSSDGNFGLSKQSR